MKYQLIKHNSGEVFAVQHQGTKFYGVCGPLHHSEYNAEALDLTIFEYTSEDIEWLNDHSVEMLPYSDVQYG